MWINTNTNDIALDIQDKFHLEKVATIEKRVIEFDYYHGGNFVKYRVEPYELRNGGFKVFIFFVEELTDDLLNRFPIECFEFKEGLVILNLKVKEDFDEQRIMLSFTEKNNYLRIIIDDKY